MNRIAVALVTLSVAVAMGVSADQRVFCTSGPVFPNFDGVAGGDAICQTTAGSAGLGGTWVAWLSDSTSDVVDRLHGDGAFVLLDGTQVASSRADLLDGTLESSIDVDQNSNLVESQKVWTGTFIEGVASTLHCGDWTSLAENGTVGMTSNNQTGWTSAFTSSCDSPAYLYCFESTHIFVDGFESGGTDDWSHASP
jgi:hypothetical protein